MRGDPELAAAEEAKNTPPDRRNTHPRHLTVSWRFANSPAVSSSTTKLGTSRASSECGRRPCRLLRTLPATRRGKGEDLYRWALCISCADWRTAHRRGGP